MSNFHTNRRTYILDCILAKNGQNKAKMAKFGKTNYFTKIALVYLCLCQIFSQIEENERIYGKTGKRAKRENEDF